MRKLTSPSKPNLCGAGKRRLESKGRIAPKRKTYFKAKRADQVGEIESVDDSSEVEGIELGTFGQPISPPPGFSGNDDEHANFHDIDDLSS
nr:hypothetical protein CFP56_02299 [Quercus suber]